MGSRPTVLVLTTQTDTTADLVVRELNERDVAVFRFDTALFPTELTVSAQLDDGWNGSLWFGGREVELARAGSVYYRRPGEFVMPESMSPATRRFAAAQSRAGLLGVLVSLNCLWVNHPGRNGDASYKPWQLTGGVVDDDGLPKGMPTSIVDTEGLDDSITLCAHQSREWVDKHHEIRLTVVGNAFSAAEIHAGSDAAHVDWRNDYASLTYRVVDVPGAVRRGVVELMRRFGLVFGALDFVVTPAGEWRFLEINPNGQWGWIQTVTGLPISNALADLLQRGAAS
ncbi:MvdC/MvdD family ATP grasp protein [Phytoactinopolyspora mesophila]|uniref:RimK domain-containing protein n=1 Tax=Phytoactinopolyspora mesophila TaxID=2650750 RepID=A0A7K3MCR6_9ACTN|nr:RimK domain-containing protein [Phytoactinopolyspora mesophila]NDL60188.1 RimK domain-containing protein [Phytoactinopolyspora mesophila]